MAEPAALEPTSEDRQRAKLIRNAYQKITTQVGRIVVGQAPPNEQLIADVKAMVDRKVVDSPDYWLANAVPGGQCDGAAVEKLLLDMAHSFEPADALGRHSSSGGPQGFQFGGILESHAVEGGKCSGNNVRAIIRNFVRHSAP